MIHFIAFVLCAATSQQVTGNFIFTINSTVPGKKLPFKYHLINLAKIVRNKTNNLRETNKLKCLMSHIENILLYHRM